MPLSLETITPQRLLYIEIWSLEESHTKRYNPWKTIGLSDIERYGSWKKDGQSDSLRKLTKGL